MSKRIGIYIRDLTLAGGAEKRTAVMAERLSHQYNVTLLVSGACPLKAIESYFAVDLSRVRIAQLTLPGHDLLRQMLGVARLGAYTRIALAQMRRAAERAYFRQIRDLRLDLFINNQGWSILKCPAPAGIYMCMFPHDRKGELRGDHGRGALYELYAGLGNRVVGMTDEVLDSYDVITANSGFTAGWIQRLWRRTAEVVYSACEEMGPPSASKERIIAHTGRFVAEGRNDDKHQRTLIEAFRAMKRLHREGWELHLAGTLLSDAASVRSYRRLVAATRGLPVRLHPCTPFEELRNLYRRASIYWHATGYGHSADKHPGKQEHFGMTTVEAMSAGAVPVVINSGGQRETVVHESCGYLWNDLGELESYTNRLADDPALLSAFRRNAIDRSNQFSRVAFADRIEALVERLLT
ncbi:MAG TPA: glycosyltransferase [Bryobacteraceae bacterium]|jgi:glycosyltransferase involved in cell wall biosynthesis|nr:glycosyltransferase [Bryobacteraceae bacterium]